VNVPDYADVVRVFLGSEWYEVAPGTFRGNNDGFICTDAKTSHLLVGPWESIGELLTRHPGPADTAVVSMPTSPNPG
jgi:hypothetical protein